MVSKGGSGDEPRHRFFRPLGTNTRFASEEEAKFYKELLSLTPVLMARAMHFTKSNIADSEDVVQQTLLQAHQYRKQFRGESSLKTWVAPILFHEFLRFSKRREYRDVITGEEAELALAHAAVFDKPDFIISLKETLAHIQRLPEKQRQAVQLIAIDGMTYKEAGDFLGVSEGTMKSRFSRAKTTLLKFRGGESPL